MRLSLSVRPSLALALACTWSTAHAGEPPAALTLAAPEAALAGPIAPTPVATGAPKVRTYGQLTIHNPPMPRTESTRGIVTTDTEGTFRAADPRVWVGLPVPNYVPAGIEGLELSQLLATPTGHFALYRDYYGDAAHPGCATSNPSENCHYRGQHYNRDGTVTADIELNALMHRPEHLRIDDLAVVGNVLYLTLACQSYAREADKRCSNVVAVDISRIPLQVQWRSKYLVSNSELVPVGDYLVTGYGFTSETDFLYVLDRRTGRIALRVMIPASPEQIVVKGDVLEVFVVGHDTPIRFGMKGFASTTDKKGRARPSSPVLTRTN